jgi:hypothetical protein
MALVVILLILFLVAGVATIEYRIGKLLKAQRESLHELKWIRYHLAVMHKAWAQQMEDAESAPAAQRPDAF